MFSALPHIRSIGRRAPWLAFLAFCLCLIVAPCNALAQETPGPGDQLTVSETVGQESSPDAFDRKTAPDAASQEAAPDAANRKTALAEAVNQDTTPDAAGQDTAPDAAAPNAVSDTASDAAAPNAVSDAAAPNAVSDSASDAAAPSAASEATTQEADPNAAHQKTASESTNREAAPNDLLEESAASQFPLEEASVPLASERSAQDNGIPAIRLTIDPDEYQNMVNSQGHQYRATGASIDLTVPDGYTGEFSESELTDLTNLELEYIRGRGNTTWGDAKKPFKFKLEDKANLLGEGKTKHWVLLANSYDDSLLRNRLTAYFGRELGLEFTPKMEPVDLYVNGEYLGSYVMCPEVRIDGGSVDIEELGAGDLEEPEVTGGYLLALNPYDDEDDVNVFITDRGTRFFLEEPDFSEADDQNEAALQAQHAFITSYLQKLENILFSNSMADENGTPYSDYLDLQSAAAYWWVQEFSVNGDAFITPSTYLHKDRDGKLSWGPLWDFDLAYPNYLFDSEYESLNNTKPMKWLDRMRAHDESYKKLLRDAWNNLDELIEDVVEEGGVLDQYAAEIKNSWIANYWLWRAYDDATNEEVEASFNQAIEELRNYLKTRRDSINKTIGESLDDVYVTVRFFVDDQLVKVTELRRDTTLDKYDYPPDPEKDGYYFLKWVRDNGKDPGMISIDADCDVFANLIPDEEVTRPSGLFFPFDDVWVTTDMKTTGTQLIIKPAGVNDRRVTWMSSDPAIADIVEMHDSQYIKIKKAGTTVFTCTSSNGITASFTLHALSSGTQISQNIDDFQLKDDLLELKVGQYGQMKIIVPGPVRGYLFYESSDDEIATPAGSTTGVIEAIAPGTCTVTVRNSQGTVERQYTVIVTEAAKENQDGDDEGEGDDKADPVPAESSDDGSNADSGTSAGSSNGKNAPVAAAMKSVSAKTPATGDNVPAGFALTALVSALASALSLMTASRFRKRTTQ